jgi:hypothetical protein
MRSVKITLTVFALVLLSWGTKAQTFLYPDNNLLWHECLCHFENGVIREGNNWTGKVLLTVQNQHIFSGYSTSDFDILYSVRDNKLYLGDSYFTDAIAYTYVESEGKIYLRDSTFPLDLAYTIRPDNFKRGVINVYKDDSISPFDIVACLQGDIPTAEELFSLLLSADLL